jgi:hypothetical protein
MALLIVAIAPAGAGPATGTILIHCGYDHSAANDPIVFPRQPGASHSHDFFGSAGIDAGTTATSLQTNRTTCSFKGDHSGYWVPSLRGPSGNLVRPSGMRVYYRGGDRQAAELQKFPPGVKDVQGDSKNTNPNNYAATYRCESGALTGPYIPTRCAGNSGFEASYYFPFCATGETDNITHKTLVGRTLPCPDPHLSVLQMQMIVSYPREAVGGRLVSDESLDVAGGLTSHADFFDGWNPAALDMVLDRCIRPNAECQVDEDGSVYRTGTNAVVIPAGAFRDAPNDRSMPCGPPNQPGDPQAAGTTQAIKTDGSTAARPMVTNPARPQEDVALSTSLAALTERLAASDPRRLAHKRTIANALAFSGAGRITVAWRLRRGAGRSDDARRRGEALVIGRGSLARASAGCAKIKVVFTVAGHRLMRQARTLRIVLEATFTPAAGRHPATSRRALTLRRRRGPTAP